MSAKAALNKIVRDMARVHGHINVKAACFALKLVPSSGHVLSSSNTDLFLFGSHGSDKCVVNA
jgi:hypothetical protein